MNRDEVRALPDKELRIKTAELLEFEPSWGPMTLREWIEEGNNTAHLNGKRTIIPNWPENIAAAMELESALPLTIIKHYTRDLQLFIGAYTFRLIHASARDRTRAFILAMTREEKVTVPLHKPYMRFYFANGYDVSVPLPLCVAYKETRENPCG